LLHRELLAEFAATANWVGTVHTRTGWATVHSTLLRETAVSTEEELLSGAATEFTFCFSIASHSMEI